MNGALNLFHVVFIGWGELKFTLLRLDSLFVTLLELISINNKNHFERKIDSPAVRHV